MGTKWYNKACGVNLPLGKTPKFAPAGGKMKELKKMLSIALALCLAITVFPVYSGLAEVNSSAAENPSKLINNGNLVIDDDGSDGYTGDYVVIYNPGTSSYSSMNTGSLNGLIETEVGGAARADNGFEADDRGYVIDVDSQMPKAELDRTEQGQSLSFNVGDRHVFELYSSYCPLPNTNVEFKVIAKGEHCYIWTPTSTAANVYPLDGIDPSFGQICADEFDSKFDLMQTSFGDHANGSQGDGRLNILYYNIDDGWQPGEGYVAGFFSGSDLASNGMPILNIDTYPGVYYVNSQGEVNIDITDTYNTMVHEYQHLIHYSQVGYSESWITECMSAAAEEICYPGSSISRRVQSWMNYSFNTNDDWLNPPTEHEYVPAWELHNGYSMYDWSNYLDMSDRLALYAQVSFYAQYIFTQYGNPTFRAILENIARGQSFFTAFESATGQDVSEFTRNFRIAMVANAPELYDGLYGFSVQEGYDPAEYHNVENLYNLLAPVVFTGNSCSISGGGAITVKPVDGVFYPPAGADSGLQYYGISIDATPPEPVALTGISLNPGAVEVYTGANVRISTVREPENANNFELTWTSSDPAVATVSGNNRNASIEGVSTGTATVTVTAHDNLNGIDYTASCSVTVKATPTVDEALNVPGGTLHFENSSSYGFGIDLTSDEGRVSAVSTNQGVSSSASTITLTAQLNAGDVLSFDWRVSSETRYDVFKFLVNGTKVEEISGDTSWATYTYTAPTTGEYTFSWTYSKDSSVDRNDDSAWLDNVSIPGGETPEYPIGDVDMDGRVSVTDAVMIMRHAMGLITLTEQQLALADVNADGSIGIVDATLALRVAMGL